MSTGQNLTETILSTHLYYDFADTQNNRESLSLQADIALPHIAIPQGEKLAVKLTARDKRAKNYIQSDLQADWSSKSACGILRANECQFCFIIIGIIGGSLDEFHALRPARARA